MGVLEANTTLIYGVHIRESANDGSDFSNAAADYRVLFLGEDGQLHVKDSAGSVTELGGGSSRLFSRRLMAIGPNAADETFNVNSTSYVAPVSTMFYHDWDIFPATHFLITCYGRSSESGQTVTLQLTPQASPTNPVSAAGNDLSVVFNGGAAQVLSSGWVAVSDSMSGLTLMTVAIVGSNTTVDFVGRWLDIAFKIN